ncbi:MAG: 50S ribosomal protein L28 [Anaerolineae bacterium]|nr:50S ribosomal protein L28 [Anaerolineae bacterium]
MAHRCALCGKARPQFGNNVSFSQRHTKRRWKPNIQHVTIRCGDRLVRAKVCTRCLRTLAKAG